MPDPYPIMNVDPEWERAGEVMGSKPKFWFRRPTEGRHRWLFKYPQPQTGQHWAEKIAAEVARALSIEHAVVELARFKEQQGSATRSFVTPHLDRGIILWHGNEILSRFMAGYEKTKEQHQKDHALKNIWTSIDQAFGNRARAMQVSIADYLTLDALIGNTDRHHENWGFVLHLPEGDSEDWPLTIAPSFDHASSLGRELLDERRERILRKGRVKNYVEKGRGGIYWTSTDNHAPSPLELVRRAADVYPESFGPALSKLQNMDEGTMQRIVGRVPADWMSPAAQEFALALMRYSLGELRRLQR